MVLFEECHGGIYVGNGLVMAKFPIVSRHIDGPSYNCNNISSDGFLNSLLLNSKNNSPIIYDINNCFDEYKDWFVPSIEELEYIVNLFITNNKKLPLRFDVRFIGSSSSRKGKLHEILCYNLKNQKRYHGMNKGTYLNFLIVRRIS